MSRILGSPGDHVKQRPKDKNRQVLTNPDSFATTLVVLLVDQYTSEALTWALATIKKELESDFNVEIPPINMHKLGAAISILTSDDFFKRLPRFMYLCNILSGVNLPPGVVDLADAQECAWGMTEALLLDPPEEGDEEPFVDEIRYYLGEVLDAEGIKTPPDLLRLAIRDTSSGQASFSGMATADPSLFSAEFKMQQDAGQEIEKEVRENLQELFDQLKSLDLEDGDTDELVSRLQGNLQAD